MTIEQAKAEGIIVNPFLVRIFDRNQTIAQLWNEGHSRQFIADQFGISRKQVRKIVKRMSK